jgi:signal transduction histidine kinase
MKGVIQIDSRPNIGTCVALNFPASPVVSPGVVAG